ncbi:MAG: SseB family protein [Actinomycetaceae bacterium]|nr:SseB family protein [Arcanobacterium sp.]MDD7505377.1 SseB family protein [Actinomycetaceae bacterium]MDY6142941.1 SseB family protein [Arcanobacterium sp.]
MPDFSQLLKDNPFAGDDGSLTTALAKAFDEPEHLRFEAVVASLGRVVIPVMPHARPAVDPSGKVAEHQKVSANPLDDAGDDLLDVDFPGGRKAYPIFSSAQALAQYDPQARPLLVTAQNMAQAAMTRGEGLLVLDPGLDAQQWLGRSAVVALATGKGDQWVAPWNDERIPREVQSSLPYAIPGFDHIVLEPARYGAVRVIVHILAGTSRDQAVAAIETIAAILTRNEYVRARLDVVEIRPFFAGV